MHIRELTDYLDSFLDVKAFSDPSYNGLQVEAGPEEVLKIATSCTASLEAIDAAVESGADALIVHHGLFWKGASPVLTGNYMQRVQSLIEGKMHLLAYHLPMDAHAELGNNAVISHMLGGDIQDYATPGDKRSIALRTKLASPLTVREIAAVLTKRLDTAVSVMGNLTEDVMLDDLMICTGSGSFLIDGNTRPDFQALITGDVNEQTRHMAVETGTVVFAVGHHASEQPAMGFLGDHLAEKFSLQHTALHFCYERDLVTYMQEDEE